MRDLLASPFSLGDRRQVLHYLNAFQMRGTKWVLPAEMPSGKASFLNLRICILYVQEKLGQTRKVIPNENEQEFVLMQTEAPS